MDNEHSVAIVSFGGAVKREVRRVREQLKKCDEISRFELHIKAEGRVNDGDVKIEYAIGAYGGEVRGNSIDAVVTEWLRRKGWENAHAPTAIGYERIPTEDTIEDTF